MKAVAQGRANGWCGRRRHGRPVWHIPFADGAGGRPRHCWQHPSGAEWETPAVPGSGSSLACRKPGWGREVGAQRQGAMRWDAQQMGRRAPRTPQPLAAADAADVNMLNRLMLRLVMASAPAVIAFPRRAALQNSPTPLAFRSGSFNHRIQSCSHLNILKAPNLHLDW